MPRNVVVFNVGAAPADFFEGVFRDAAAECLAHQLPAEAVADHRDVLAGSVANQRTLLRDPRQRVVDAHRATHEAQSRERIGTCRNRIVPVDGDYLEWNRVRFEECGKISGSLNKCVTENGDGFHDE